MKKTGLLFLISISSFFMLSGSPVELINIDFTRDSVEWKAKFPTPTWSKLQTDLFVNVKDIRIGEYLFKGAFGKFNPGTSVMAQPICNADTTKNHSWAFRINRNKKYNSYLELPKLSSAGKFTILCKNGNAEIEDTCYIQKKEENEWVTIKTLYLPPHYNRNYEMQMEEYLNLNTPVTLRIAGATRNMHVYAVKVNAYDASEPIEKPLRLILLPDPQALPTENR